MMSDTSFNSMRKGEGNKKMIPCRYFAMGKCNKGNDCPYSHDLSLQNTSGANPTAQHPQKKQHSSRYEGMISKLNGRISALAKASTPYGFIVGCTNNCYQLFDSSLSSLQPSMAAGPITSIEVHNDLYYVASAASSFMNSCIYILQPTTNNQTSIEGERANICSMFYTDDYNMLFVAYDNGNIQCWNLTDQGFKNVTSFSFSSSILCMTYVDSILIVGLEGGNIGVVFLSQNEKQENHVADCNIVNMHVVTIGGVNQLVVVFSGGYVYSYSISDFNVIKMENLNAKISSSCVCQTLNNEWMLLTSCEVEGKKPVVSVLKINTFEKKGLIYELPSLATHMVSLGKTEKGGDYVVAGCEDNSLHLLNLSH